MKAYVSPKIGMDFVYLLLWRIGEKLAPGVVTHFVIGGDRLIRQRVSKLINSFARMGFPSSVVLGLVKPSRLGL